MQFIPKSYFKQWLDLDQVGNFGISHATDGNSQTKYASESAVGAVGRIAREALKKASDAVSGGVAKIAEVANVAKKLQKSFSLSLKGDISGSVSIDGSQNVSITAIVRDNSHRHTFSQIDGFPAGIINQKAYDGRYLLKGGKAADANNLDGINSTGFCRAYSASYSTGKGTWTTDQFVAWLKSKGAFTYPYWVMRGSWSYASNRVLDTGVGKINFAGCVIEVIGNINNHTIRVTTPTTSSGGGTTNAEFIYVFNGDGYSPGWRRSYNTARKPTPAEIGAEPTLNTDQKRKISIGKGNPSGGSSGDIYIQYE
ncbi:tail fiber protein [Vibrio phage vB_VpM-pA2SJ1]|uniref:Tail fiber protein n=1 Tax=Vibrio phage vB_VpM-pA2SJ1 TaxID=3095964 RepID=A0AAX4J5V9_9CAUD